MEDWIATAVKEAAAQEQESINDDDVELEFSTQALMQIQNKVRPLANPEYMLGFEIVWKNNSNSKMLGIYAFRVGRKLYYAPVFFVNGKIKGTELFYREDTKTFVNATPEWAEYLISLGEPEEGDPVDRKLYDTSPKQMDISDIAFSPSSGRGFRKRASSINLEGDVLQEYVDVQDDFVKNAGFVWKSMQDSTKLAAEEVSPIRKFLETFGDDAFLKLSNAMLANDKLARDIIELVPQEDWMPETLKVSPTEKKASTEFSGIRVFRDLMDDRVPSEKRASHMKKGYTIVDKRADSGLDEVYEAHEEVYETIDAAGVYDVLLCGGEIKTLIVIPISQCIELDNFNGPPNMTSAGDKYYSGEGGKNNYWTSDDQQESGYKPLEATVKRFILMDPKTRKSREVRGPVYGLLNNDVDSLESYYSEPQVGSAYYVIDKGDTGVPDIEVSHIPFYVAKKRKSDGVTIMSGGTHSLSSQESSWKKIKINDDLNGHAYQHNVFGKSTVAFIKADVDVETHSDGYKSINWENLEDQLGTSNDLSLHLKVDVGYKKATLNRSMASGDVDYQLTMGEGCTTPQIDRIDMIATIMKASCVREDAAEAILDECDAVKGQYTFLTVKSAAGIILETSVPHFYEGSFNEFGVLQQEESQTAIINETRMDDNEERYFNSTYPDTQREDAINRDRALIEVGSPEELAEHARITGKRTVFEHGVVGQLAKTYDASDVLKTYIGDMIQALDKLGRTIFLFYWRPEDFVEAYGSDDQADLEQMFQSSFRSFGELVLELLQKNPEEDVPSSKV